MKQHFRELVCTCASARALLYQSLLVHRPKCPFCKALLMETDANVCIQDSLGFMVPVPTALEDRAERRSHLTPPEPRDFV